MLLLEIILNHNAAGAYFIKQPKIAQITGWTRETVNRRLSRLKKISYKGTPLICIDSINTDWGERECYQLDGLFKFAADVKIHEKDGLQLYLSDVEKATIRPPKKAKRVTEASQVV